MTIRFIRNASMGLPVGTIRTFAPAVEAALIADKEAVSTTEPNDQSDIVPVWFDRSTGSLVRQSGEKIGSAVPGDGNLSCTVTIPAGRVSSAVTIPVLIDGQSLPAAWWSNVAADGANIRAYLPGGAMLPIDVVMCDTSTRQAVIMVLVALSPGADTAITLTATTQTAALPVTHPRGRNAVWAAYAMVFGGGATACRAGSGASLTITNGMGLGVVGRVAGFANAHQGVAYDWARDVYHAVDTTVVSECGRDGVPTGKTLQLAALNVATANHFGQGVAVGGVLYLPVERYINSTTFSAQTLVAVDSATYEMLWKVDISAQAHECSAIAYNAASGELLISAYGVSGNLYRYSLSGAYLGSITLGETLTNVQGIAYNPADSKIYVSLEQPFQGVRRIDPTTWAVEAGYLYICQAPDAPEGLTYGPGGVSLTHDCAVSTGTTYLVQLSPERRAGFQGALYNGQPGGGVPQMYAANVPAGVQSALQGQTWWLTAWGRTQQRWRNQAAAVLGVQGAATPRAGVLGRYIGTDDVKLAMWDDNQGWAQSTQQMTPHTMHVWQAAYQPATRRGLFDGQAVAPAAVAVAKPPTATALEFRICHPTHTAASSTESLAGEVFISALAARNPADAEMQAVDASWRTPAAFYSVA